MSHPTTGTSSESPDARLPLLDPDRLEIEPHALSSRVALFSLDTETDYGTGRSEALSQIERFADLLDELQVPWTAFVEGQFFETRRELCGGLRDRGVDLQLHCYDHARPGDTPDDLRRSAAAYADFLGKRPQGYRAHTYRLTRAVFDALVSEGFEWDSSLMRAYAQGGNRHVKFRSGDYLVLNGRLVEFPIGTWGRLPVPLNHTHVLLAKRPGELALRSLFGAGRLVNYNFHMTDLVRCGSLASAKRTPMVRLLHKYAWSTHGGDTFPVVRRFVAYLRRQGYDFLSTSALYERVGR
ncbi:MAG TPA: polysaccharide deacetylase family protein [Vicinamibacterales bacterium]|nr:polysaccharide deacetylase family protein [Vicinamibacterales bacterium]